MVIYKNLLNLPLAEIKINFRNSKNFAYPWPTVHTKLIPPRHDAICIFSFFLLTCIIRAHNAGSHREKLTFMQWHEKKGRWQSCFYAIPATRDPVCSALVNCVIKHWNKLLTHFQISKCFVHCLSFGHFILET